MRVPTSVFVVAFVLALPVILPYAFVSHYLYQRRLRSAADARACPSCGSFLGVAALKASDDRWLAHVAEVRRAHPGVRLRLVRLIRAICLTCGAQLQYGEESATFTLS